MALDKGDGKCELFLAIIIKVFCNHIRLLYLIHNAIFNCVFDTVSEH